MNEVSELEPPAHSEFFRDVLQDIHAIMETDYQLTNVSIKPIGAEVARLRSPSRSKGPTRMENRLSISARSSAERIT